MEASQKAAQRLETKINAFKIMTKVISIRMIITNKRVKIPFFSIHWVISSTTVVRTIQLSFPLILPIYWLFKTKYYSNSLKYQFKKFKITGEKNAEYAAKWEMS